MNGVHDVGGIDGMGAVAPADDESVFAADWERVIFGVLNSGLVQGLYNLDQIRHSTERMPALEYLATSYFEHWLYAAEQLLLHFGVIDADELDVRTEAHLTAPDTPLPEREIPELITTITLTARNGVSSAREVARDPIYGVRDSVRSRNEHPHGHTRNPRYVRGREGVVTHVSPAAVFPDDHEAGRGENPQFVYTVRFEASELWGQSAESNAVVCIDLFEPYLEPATRDPSPGRGHV